MGQPRDDQLLLVGLACSDLTEDVLGERLPSLNQLGVTAFFEGLVDRHSPLDG